MALRVALERMRSVSADSSLLSANRIINAPVIISSLVHSLTNNKLESVTLPRRAATNGTNRAKAITAYPMIRLRGG